jgi:ABC-type branched-subunit amino acid transport system substrate-binding protein
LVSTKVIAAVAVVVIVAVAGAWWFLQPKEPEVMDPIKIGFLAGLTGPTALPAQSLRNGLMLAAEQINDMGGILNHPVELYIRDTRGMTEYGLTAVDKLIYDDEVDMIIGTYRSGVCLAVLDPIVVEGQLIFINTGSSSPTIPQHTIDDYDTYKYLFMIHRSVNGTADLYDSPRYEFWNELGQTYLGRAPRIYNILERLTWQLTQWEQKSVPYFERLGIEYEVAWTPEVVTDYTSYILAAQEWGADIIHGGGSAAAGIIWTKNTYDMQVDVPCEVPDIVSTRYEAFDETDSKCIYATGTYSAGRFPFSNKTLQFYDDYSVMFGFDPMWNAQASYDALFFVKKAVEDVGYIDPADLRNRDSGYQDILVDAMEDAHITGSGGDVKMTSSHTNFWGPQFYYSGMSQWQWTNEATGEADIHIIYPDVYVDRGMEFDIPVGEWKPAPWLKDEWQTKLS